MDIKDVLQAGIEACDNVMEVTPSVIEEYRMFKCIKEVLLAMKEDEKKTPYVKSEKYEIHSYVLNRIAKLKNYIGDQDLTFKARVEELLNLEHTFNSYIPIDMKERDKPDPILEVYQKYKSYEEKQIQSMKIPYDMWQAITQYAKAKA